MELSIYFDLDGTLVSQTTDEDAIVPTARSFDLSLSEEQVYVHSLLVGQYFSRNFPNGIRRATEVWCEHYDFAIDPAAFTRELKQEKIRSTQPRGDLEDTLTALCDTASLGILTNGESDVQRGKLNKHDLARFFDPLLISGEMETMKPEDEIFQSAMEAQPGEYYIYVADKFASDIVPAQENDFLGVFVADTPSPAADCTVSSVSELTLDELREATRTAD
ncbi:MAG TPA: HAD family hydrolase [Halococcus sp.]|nr:HAD family hydrolase [Halococcus sp.]